MEIKILEILMFKIIKNIIYVLFDNYLREPLSSLILFYFSYYDYIIFYKGSMHVLFDTQVYDVLYHHLMHVLIIGLHSNLLAIFYYFIIFNIHFFFKNIYYKIYYKIYLYVPKRFITYKKKSENEILQNLEFFFDIYYKNEF